jgi:Flp pilus assembly protein TadB
MSAVQVFKDKLDTSLLQLEKTLQLEKYPAVDNVLNQASQKSGQPRMYFVVAAIALAALLVVQLLGLSFISNLFAFIPIYASFKALRTPEVEDDEFWLTYWLVRERSTYSPQQRHNTAT